MKNAEERGTKMKSDTSRELRRRKKCKKVKE